MSAIKSGLWTKEEDALLAKYQEEVGNRWTEVAKRIGTKTGQQCAQRWRHRVNPNISKEKWSVEEDRQLASLVRQHGSSWAEISRHLPGRTDQQCMGRWRRHLDPSIRRSAWTLQEDAALHALVAQLGKSWCQISKHMQGRTAQQIRAHWCQLQQASRVAWPRTDFDPGADFDTGAGFDHDATDPHAAGVGSWPGAEGEHGSASGDDTGSSPEYRPLPTTLRAAMRASAAAVDAKTGHAGSGVGGPRSALLAVVEAETASEAAQAADVTGVAGQQRAQQVDGTGAEASTLDHTDHAAVTSRGSFPADLRNRFQNSAGQEESVGVHRHEEQSMSRAVACPGDGLGPRVSTACAQTAAQPLPMTWQAGDRGGHMHEPVWQGPPRPAAESLSCKPVPGIQGFPAQRELAPNTRHDAAPDASTWTGWQLSHSRNEPHTSRGGMDGLPTLSFGERLSSGAEAGLDPMRRDLPDWAAAADWAAAGLSDSRHGETTSSRRSTGAPPKVSPPEGGQAGTRVDGEEAAPAWAVGMPAAAKLPGCEEPTLFQATPLKAALPVSLTSLLGTPGGMSLGSPPLLALLQSPGSASTAGRDALVSPQLQGLLTPEWTRAGLRGPGSSARHKPKDLEFFASRAAVTRRLPLDDLAAASSSPLSNAGDRGGVPPDTDLLSPPKRAKRAGAAWTPGDSDGPCGDVAQAEQLLLPDTAGRGALADALGTRLGLGRAAEPGSGDEPRRSLATSRDVRMTLQALLESA